MNFMNKSLIKKLYSRMLRIRLTEMEISKRYSQWKMRCPVHLSIGQESTPTSICENLGVNDEIEIILPTFSFCSAFSIRSGL